MLTLRTPLVHCAWSVLYRVRLPLSFLVLPVVLLFMSFGCVTALLGLAPHVTGLSLSGTHGPGIAGTTTTELPWGHGGIAIPRAFCSSHVGPPASAVC